MRRLTMEIPNKELAQLLISGKRKTVAAKNLKHATAIRVAGHRLGHVLTVQQEGRDIWLVLSEQPVRSRLPDDEAVNRKAAVRTVTAKPKRARKKGSVLD